VARALAGVFDRIGYTVPCDVATGEAAIARDRDERNVVP